MFKRSFWRALPVHFFLCSLYLSSPAWGAEVLSLEVEQEGHDYHVAMEAVLEAPMLEVWRLLTDYPGLKALSPAVEVSEVLAELAPDRHRVRTQSRLCVFIFCGNIVQVQIMHQAAFGDLQAEIEAKGSDFESGKLHWWLEEQQGAVRLQFRADLRLAFAVPPLVGPWAVKRVLRQEAMTIVTSLERLAGVEK